MILQALPKFKIILKFSVHESDHCQTVTFSLKSARNNKWRHPNTNPMLLSCYCHCCLFCYRISPETLGYTLVYPCLERDSNTRMCLRPRGHWNW